jgi:hypothetical protein
MAKTCRERFREEPEESIDGLLEYVKVLCPTVPDEDEDGSTTVVDTFTPTLTPCAEVAHKGPHETETAQTRQQTNQTSSHSAAASKALAKHFSNCSTRRPSPALRRNSTPRPDSIHLAAKKGNVVDLAVHLQTAWTIEELDDEGMQALHYAAAYGHPEATEYGLACLIAIDVFLACPRVFTSSPLAHCFWLLRVIALRMLVQSNALMDACDNEGSTPLLLACRYARKDCIQKPIAAGVRMEGSIETRYISALHSAAYNGNVECIEVLLEAKAQVHEKDIDSGHPFTMLRASTGLALWIFYYRRRQM